ncbi:MAG: hypothetical protein ABH835_05120 [Patescibacteria group bacterium]
MEGNKKTILIVEDEKPMQKALTGKFSAAGHKVFNVKNGKDGLKIAL